MSTSIVNGPSRSGTSISRPETSSARTSGSKQEGQRCPFGHVLFHEVERSGLQRHRRDDAVSGQPLPQSTPGGGTGLPKHERLSLEVLPTDVMPARERMAGPRRHDELHVPQRPGAQLRRVGLASHDRQMVGEGLHAPDRLLRGAVPEQHGDAWVSLLESGDGRHEEAGGHLCRPDAQFVAAPSTQILEGLFEPVRRLEDRSGLLVQDLALLRKLHSPAGFLEQADLVVRLQAADRVRHRLRSDHSSSAARAKLPSRPAV